MDVINESRRKFCSRTSNIYYDWGRQCAGTKGAENGVLSNFELNFSNPGS